MRLVAEEEKEDTTESGFSLGGFRRMPTIPSVGNDLGKLGRLPTILSVGGDLEALGESSPMSPPPAPRLSARGAGILLSFCPQARGWTGAG